MNKISYYFLLFGFLFLTFSSCKPEPFDDFNTSSIDEEIQIRSSDTTCLSGIVTEESLPAVDCFPGNYFIENGILTFENHEEFLKTINFLGCADDNVKESWITNISIETPYKKYNEVLTLICGDLEIIEIETILDQHSNHIIYSWDDESELIIRPIYSTYQYFRNMNGYFKIGDNIDAEVNDNRIVVLDGGFSKLQEVLVETNNFQDTILNFQDTSVVIFRDIKYADPTCCPNSQEEQFFYENNERRLTSRLIWNDVSMPFLENDKYFIDPILMANMFSELEKRGTFRWKAHRRHFRFRTEIDWFVVPTGTSETDGVSYGVRNNSWTSIVSGMVPLSPFTSNRIGPYDEVPEQIICVYRTEQTTRIYEDLSQAPEQTFTMTCEEIRNPQICQICPDNYGWEWRPSEAACISKWCPADFVWEGGIFYHQINGGCPFGGTPSGTACYVGHVPNGWENEVFVRDHCVYAEGRCP